MSAYGVERLVGAGGCGLVLIGFLVWWLVGELLLWRRDRCDLAWSAEFAQAIRESAEPRLAFADDVVAVAMLDGPL